MSYEVFILLEIQDDSKENCIFILQQLQINFCNFLKKVEKIHLLIILIVYSSYYYFLR